MTVLTSRLAMRMVRLCLSGGAIRYGCAIVGVSGRTGRHDGKVRTMTKITVHTVRESTIASAPCVALWESVYGGNVAGYSAEAHFYGATDATVTLFRQVDDLREFASVQVTDANGTTSTLFLDPAELATLADAIATFRTSRQR